MTKKRNHMIKAGVIVFAIAIMLLAVSSFGVAAPKKTLVFADLNWDSAQVHSRIAAFIIENGYGYKTEYIPGGTIPLWAGLTRGDVDINMECWVDNQQEAYDKGIAAGKVIDLGSNFPDSWQGWLVPTYVVKGDSKRGSLKMLKTRARGVSTPVSPAGSARKSTRRSLSPTVSTSTITFFSPALMPH